MKNNFPYTETMVRFYDVIYNNIAVDGDRDFYINEMLNSGGPVLEIGCGTGRIFVEALKKGVDIYGIDQNELMLCKLKEKLPAKDHFRANFMDARTLKFNKRFKLIIAPFRVFQHILTIDEQLEVLNNVYENLDGGGRFIFDVFNPDLGRISKGTNEILQFDGEYMPGKILRRYDHAEPDAVNQIINVTFKFEWEDEKGIQTDEFYTPMRYFFRYELEHLVARSKLKLENMYGDFKCNELSSFSKHLICICTD